MYSNQWESSYRRAADKLHSPHSMDEKLLANARAIKPVRKINSRNSRLLSKAASGFSAIAIVIALLHPAQYLGATPGQIAPQGNNREQGLERYRPKPGSLRATAGGWHKLRAEVEAGSYIQLCAQWRRQQRSPAEEKLPADLQAKARQHCRLLP